MSSQLIAVADPTDRQRVEAMFLHLSAARQIFAVMFSASRVDALTELQDTLDSGRPYCFFDQQDGKAFGADGYLTQPLFLSWGIIQDLVVDGPIATIPEEWLHCAEAIVTAGVLAGLHITWEGTARKRIGVQPSRVSPAAPVHHSRN